MTTSLLDGYMGQSYVFSDGRSIKIIQIKNRDEGYGDVPWVTYEINYNNSFPKRQILSEGEFLGVFGHLFPQAK